ncbi:MAG TPA: PAS domain S-box protein, partial [Thermoanaerobaculia bacterium]|nr:PAS domain S-box protein [Thermoanaerobaculia bacterium]
MSPDSIYRDIIREAVEYAILLLDVEGKVETWNRGAEQIFGHTPDEIVGHAFSKLFTEEDRAVGAPEKELRTAERKGHAEDTRWYLRADGSTFFSDGVTTALRDPSGTLTGFIKVARDITDRHRAEQRLAAQLALTTLLSDEQPISVVARRVMQAVCENLGWDVGALWEIDQGGDRISCIDFWHAEHVDGTIAAELCSGQAFARGEGIPGEVWNAGESVWVASLSDSGRYPRSEIAARAGMRVAVGFPIVHEGKVGGMMEFFSRQQREPDQPLMPVMTLIGAQIGAYIDRRRTTKALRESEEHYRLVSETAQDAIFTIDDQSTILSCNPAVERIFGYQPSELIGHNLEMIIPERLRESHHRGIARYLRTGKRNIPWNAIELPALHRDGHEFPAEMSFGAWTSERGTLFTGYARDITERKRAAEELRRSLAEAEAARDQLHRRAEEEAAFRHLASALTGAVETVEVLYEITTRATHVTRADGVYVERIVGDAGMVEVVATAGRGTPPRGLLVGYPGSMTEEIISRREPVILTDMRAFGQSMAPYLMDSCANCQLLVTPLVAEHAILGALVLLNSRQSGRVFRESDTVRARTLGDLASLALRRVRLMEDERTAKERLETAVRVRDETLGVVSHDLRNPLTKISLSADLLADARPEQQHDLIATI